MLFTMLCHSTRVLGQTFGWEIVQCADVDAGRFPYIEQSRTEPIVW